MRKSIRQFAGIIAKTLPIEQPVYEFGALQLPGLEGIADLRSFFSGKEYVGCDMREGTGVDRVLNLHHIDQPDSTVGTVITLDTLEHVEFPHTALHEIHRILKPDGIVVITSVLDFRIHATPYDYWRFTPDGFRSLLAPFASSFVGYAGIDRFPHTVVGIGFKGRQYPLEKFYEEFEKWRVRWLKQKGNSWKDVANLFVPPILLGLDRRIAHFFGKSRSHK
ncbi:MAG: class I SAM-dependent methyltransferase [Syntrophobacterales bacterium]|nr:class I SAM-dependent methyltransferase [Syntrophobacterales bacterium]